MSKTNIADGLATSAVLCMGETNERQPLAIITGAPIVFANKIKQGELIIDPKKDIYAPLFSNFRMIKNKSNAKRK
jgi:F420-0:gamma-glutamyl ligase